MEAYRFPAANAYRITPELIEYGYTSLTTLLPLFGKLLRQAFGRKEYEVTNKAGPAGSGPKLVVMGSLFNIDVTFMHDSYNGSAVTLDFLSVGPFDNGFEYIGVNNQLQAGKGGHSKENF